MSSSNTCALSQGETNTAMEFQQLGQTDLTVSRVGLGCWAMGRHGWGRVDDADSTTAIRHALDVGINFFDTADVYGFGHSETLLADALGNDRHRVHIATKAGVAWDASGRTYRDLSPDRLASALDASLARMHLDCISLFQIHWPDGKTPIADVMERLVRCRDAGKIRWIGCSNFNADELTQAMTVEMPASLQVPYNLLDRHIEKSLLPFCRQARIPAVSYGSLAQGALSGRYEGNATFLPGDVRARSGYFGPDNREVSASIVNCLREIGARVGRTPAQVAIRWVLDQPGVACALTGAKTAAQIGENSGALGWTLSADDLRLLDTVSGRTPSESTQASQGGDWNEEQ